MGIEKFQDWRAIEHGRSGGDKKIQFKHKRREPCKDHPQPPPLKVLPEKHFLASSKEAKRRIACLENPKRLFTSGRKMETIRPQSSLPRSIDSQITERYHQDDTQTNWV
jgi:hypothetical protein